MIRDAVSDQVTAAFTPAAIKEMLRAIGTYVDRNSEILMTLDLSQRYSFGDDDRAVIYNAIGVPEAQMIERIRESKTINKSNRNHSNPFYAACMIAMHHLIRKKMDTEGKVVMMYMSLMMYTSIHKGLYKYGANKQIIDYTIAHLDKSYRIRTMSSLFAFIKDNSDTAYDTYKTRIAKCDDADITYVSDAVWTRLKGKMVKIANAYYDNHKSGRYLNADTDNAGNDPDNYWQMDNNSFMVDRLATKVYVKLLNHQFDDRFIKYSITRSDTSYQKLKNLIDDIISTDTDNTCRRFIVLMIEYYLIASGRGIDYVARGDFITYMKSAYASNTELPQMGEMKTILDNWLQEHMQVSGRSNYGKTAKLGYKKSLYMFFVFVINYEAKI